MASPVPEPRSPRRGAARPVRRRSPAALPRRAALTARTLRSRAGGSRKKKAEQRWRWMTFPKVALIGLLTVGGLVATTIASIYGAIYTINPDLKPREKLGATIDHVAVEHAIGYIAYSARISDSKPKPEHLSLLPGDMVFVRVSLLGYKDRSYLLHTKLLDERGVLLLPAAEERPNTLVSSCEGHSPKADEDGITWRCWVRTPTPGTKYRIRVELYDEGLTSEYPYNVTGHAPMLDFKETDLFTATDH
ncbi:hypothetical protein ACFYUD_34500 [Nocardia tengchongensis]|uniref:hypothetical protein n=1 Tax=Nocardia tengchongensis TaxID=2055889 RepID=UPI0036AF0965